ncbi:MAG: DUF480 domain-containing protein [Dokdonella sp.]
MNDTGNDENDSTPALVPLDPGEARIIGCLIEKQATTPDTYPMTLNAVVVACNQKTSRDPMMELEPGAVGHSLRQLEGRGLVGASMGARSTRYEHRFDRHYEVTPRQRALLAMLMLRGPQTVNELYTRCERLADFPDADEVRVQLERMSQRVEPLVICVGRGSGQREDRHMHLLCGADHASERSEQMAESGRGSARGDHASDRQRDSGLTDRVEALEREVESLKQMVEELVAERSSRE